MKLVWMFCLLLAGKLSAASPGEELAAAEANLGSGYMMAFPMNDDDEQLAEETAQEAVKMLADSLVSDDNDDDDEKKPEEVIEENKEEKVEEQEEPMGILQAQLIADDEAEKPVEAPRTLFKRPKIEELRKILGFPPVEGPAKAKPIPQEKPKAMSGLFGKPKVKVEPSPLGGLQFNLRREDRMMRPFGLPMLKRDDAPFRPFGIPDLVQAASSILRRAIMDDNDLNDISKEDKDDEEEDPLNNDNNEQEDNDDDEDDDDEEDSVMIVPIPDPKEMNMDRPPLFRRLPIPFPFPVPRPMPQSRPRLPFPPLTPVAFFLPLAQQIMQNLRQAQPRSQPPPMIPLAPIHHIHQQQQQQHPQQNMVPFQTQIVPIHHPMPQMIPMHPPMMPIQHMVPIMQMPQAAYHMPIMVPHPQNIPRPMMRQMPRRLPMPQIQRRVPLIHPHQPMIQPMMMRRPLHQQQAMAHTRPIQRVVRPPMPPVNPLVFLMPQPMMHMAQQQVPFFHHPPQPRQPEILLTPEQVQQILMVQQQQRQQQQQHQQQDDDRVILLRSDQDESDDDQEVLILVPTDDVEVAHPRPQFLPPPQMMPRHMPTPVVDPLHRIRLLRDLLMARQAHRQPMPNPQLGRAPRVVEIVQQQLRIFPAHHQQQVMHQQRAEPSDLHPVYVPYPSQQ